VLCTDCTALITSWFAECCLRMSDRRVVILCQTRGTVVFRESWWPSPAVSGPFPSDVELHRGAPLAVSRCSANDIELYRGVPLMISNYIDVFGQWHRIISRCSPNGIELYRGVPPPVTRCSLITSSYIEVLHQLYRSVQLMTSIYIEIFHQVYQGVPLMTLSNAGIYSYRKKINM
jgi:hypothetical protein